MIKDAEKTDRLANIGMLASTVAHELRNPLSVIQTAVFNIKRKRVNKDIDKHIANIEKKLHESSQIIDNLLTYAKIRPPVKERVSLCDIIEEAMDFSRARFPGRHVVIKKKLASARGVFIEVDPLQIKELLANILNNAFQAISKTEKGVITVKAFKTKNGKAIIEISDNGAGMEKRDMDKAFEPFFTTKARGIGLGLAICAEIVSLHDGDIDMESKKNIGTRLKISLPIQAATRH